VHPLVATLGTNCLPLIVLDGRIVSRGVYPSREMLSQWTGVHSSEPAPGCCGGPAKDAASACCATDQQLKATTGVGCGCAETGCC
jgi:hypothetical protein